MASEQLIVIGGRSGVGKSTVALALHDLLAALDIKHAIVEGDYLDLAHPPAWEHRLAEQNLAAIWANYRRVGYRRLVYTNTAAVLNVPAITKAMGGAVSVTSVLLRASDPVAAGRLAKRDAGASLERHISRSNTAASHLDQTVPAGVHRLDTDDQGPAAVAELILELSGWTA